MEDAHLQDLWKDVCTSTHDDFESFIKNKIPAELFEDLEVNISNLDTFMDRMKGMDQHTMKGPSTLLIIPLCDRKPRDIDELILFERVYFILCLH